MDSSKTFSSSDVKRIPKLKLNNTSNNSLLYILSPYCPYCKEEFIRIVNLIKYHGSDISFNIAFQLSENYDIRLFNFINRLFELENDKPNLILALGDYFDKGFTIKKWLKKWGLPKKHIDKENLLYINEFIHKNEITEMPLIIVNTTLYPSGYDLKDIKYFMQDLFPNPA